jgi:hypothetical protein
MCRRVNPQPRVQNIQENWQETKCVKIVFAYGSLYLPAIRITVGVRVGAPRQLAEWPLHHQAGGIVRVCERGNDRCK